MSSITIHNLDNEVKSKLRIRAAGHGRSMEEEACMILKLNGIHLDYDITTLGDMIIKAAQGIVDEAELADFLRSLPVTEGKSAPD